MGACIRKDGWKSHGIPWSHGTVGWDASVRRTGGHPMESHGPMGPLDEMNSRTHMYL